MSGRVKNAGSIKVPQRSSLNQAIALAGGIRVLSGKVEFVRFNRDGDIDRRFINYTPKASFDSVNNPALMAGDLIRVQNSPLSTAGDILEEITEPIIRPFFLFNTFENLTQ